MTSANWSIKSTAIVTLYDTSKHTAECTKVLSFSKNPTSQSFTIEVDPDGDFDIENLDYFTIENLIPYNKNLYITNGECQVHAYYVFPTAVS